MQTVAVEGYDELIAQLNRIDDQLTKRLGREMVKKSAGVVAAEASRRCPRQRSRGRRRNTELANTITIEVRDYDKRALAITGPELINGASHGRLVEHGHKLITHGVERGTVAGKPFLGPAFDATKSQQQAVMEATAVRVMQDLGLSS